MFLDFLFVPSGKGFEKISVASLLYVRTIRGQTECVTTDGSLLTNISIRRFEELLSRYGFYRLHPAYVVALTSIVSFDQRSVKLPGITIPLGKEYRIGLKERIKIISGYSCSSNYSQLEIGPDSRLRRARV